MEELISTISKDLHVHLGYQLVRNTLRNISRENFWWM